MAEQSGRTKTLLIADDSRATQKVVSLTFGDEGWQVLVAGDADEAWRQIEAGDQSPDIAPDIVLADVYMPGNGGGIKLCERIKADNRFRHIPVVLLVGAFEPFDGAEARKVGADDLLIKPFQSIRDLVSRVGDLFNGRPKEQDADASLEESRAAQHDAPADANSDTSTHAEENSTTAATVVDDNIQYDSAASDDEFADQTLDDGLIEAVPAAQFGADAAARTGVEVEESEQVEAQSQHAPENLTIIEPLEEFDSPGQASTERESNNDNSDESDDDLYITSPDVMSAPAAVAQTTPLDPLVASGADVSSSHADEQDAARQQSLNRDSVTTPNDASLDAPFGDTTDERDEDTPPLAITEAHTQTTMPHTSSSDRDALSPAHESFAEDTLLDLDDSTAHAPHVAASDALVMDDFVLDLTDDATDADNTGLDNSSDNIDRAPQSSAPDVDALELLDAGETDSALTLPATPPNEIPVSHIEVQARDTDVAATENVARVAFTPPMIVESQSLEANHQVTESVTEVATETLMPHAASADEGAPDGEALHAGQISPEVIEQIARRAVELMSERVVQEIAWEVVPQLAELLIKQRLDQEKSDTE